MDDPRKVLHDAMALAVAGLGVDNATPNQLQLLLNRLFGAVNSKMLLREARGAANNLHRAHVAVAKALRCWDDSPQSAAILARSVHSYNACVQELLSRCAPPTLPSTRRASIKRRRERSVYHRHRDVALGD